MCDLNVISVFKDVTSTVGSEPFSAMYFGQHCGKLLLILKHDLSLLIVFRDIERMSSPEFIKSVSSKGCFIKGHQIVGNKNCILLLDISGNLWKLVNGFEFSREEDECLHSLEKDNFYEWVPFKTFNFEKVLAISTLGHGFVCLGICKNSKRKAVVLPSPDTFNLEDFNFEEMKMSNSLNYYLFNIKVSLFSQDNYKPDGESLIISDRVSGRTFLCPESGKNHLINHSNNYLVSILHFEQKKCVLLCFKDGKLTVYFYTCQIDYNMYLLTKLTIAQKCCCLGFCFLWSDGISLHHTKLVFQCDNLSVELCHLKLPCTVRTPLCLLNVGNYVLTVTANNIYYKINACAREARMIQSKPEELLLKINEGSLIVHEMNQKIDVLTYFLQCKEFMHRDNVKKMLEVRQEHKFLVIKNNSELSIRKNFWRLCLMSLVLDKRVMKMVDLQTDLNEGTFIKIENPFDNKRLLKLSLVGDFNEQCLVFDLGNVCEFEDYLSDLGKKLELILKKRNPSYLSK